VVPPERARISGEAAVFAAWLTVGVTDVVTLSFVARGAPSLRDTLAHWSFDLGYFIACGLLSYAVVWAWKRWLPPSPFVALAGVTALSLGLGVLTLTTDLENMSQRLSGRLRPELILVASVALVALGIPAALAFGRVLRRYGLRALGVLAGVAGEVANHFILRADYPAAHLFLGGACVALIAGSIAGTAWPKLALAIRDRLSPRAKRVGAALLVAAGVAALLVAPSPLVAARLTQHSGSFLPPYLNALHSRTRVQGYIAEGSDPQWFRSRAGLPAIAPGPALVGDDAVVLLIGVDALRADVINSGEHDAQLPTLAKLRSEAVAFTNARANGSQTVYSLTTLFTGTHFSQQYWSRFEGGRSYWPAADDTPRFSAQLTEAGVRTVNFTGARWMRNHWGVVAGFGEEHWVKDGGHKYSRAAVVASAIDETLAELGPGPAFVFVHFLDPHAPYNLATREGSSFERYLAECAQVDEAIGGLLETIDSNDSLRARTTVIVMADHGEAFGEHGTVRHARTLYDELLRVPLLVRIPGVTPRVVETPVSLVDLGPTILDLFGQPTPGHIMGQTLLPFVRGEPYVPTRPFIAEGRLKRAMILGNGMKIIEDTRKDVIELYDVNSDPAETNNLVNDTQRLEVPLHTFRHFFDVQQLRRPGYEAPYRP